MSNQEELDNLFEEVMFSNPEYSDKIKKLPPEVLKEVLRKSKLIVDGLDKVDKAVVSHCRDYPELKEVFLLKVMEYAVGTIYLNLGRNVSILRLFINKLVSQMSDKYPPETEEEKDD
jgi:hypothetical protein